MKNHNDFNRNVYHNKLKSSVNLADKSLEEIKAIVDKSFRPSKVKKVVLGSIIGLLSTATVVAVPLTAVYLSKPVEITVSSTNNNLETYKLEIKRGTKIKDIDIVELEGYNFNGFYKDKACSIPYKDNDRVYKKSDIYASYKIKTYFVTIPESDMYAYSTSGIVNHGENFSFSIVAKYGYNINNVVVKLGDKILTAVDGVYTIENVTENLSVSVENVEKNIYSISVIGDENCYVDIDSSVKYDEAFSFTVTPNIGYNLDNLQVTVDNKIIEAIDGIYTVANVQDNVKVKLTGVQKNVYKLSFEDVDGVNIYAPSTVLHGDNTSFTIEVKEGYTLENMQVSFEGVKSEDVLVVGTTYSITNVLQNIKVLITGVEKIKYNIEVSGDENCDVGLNSDKIAHGDDLVFEITANIGYTLENVQVNIIGAQEDDISVSGYNYTIKNVTTNIIIEISGVEKAKYDVTVEGDENCSVNLNNNKIIHGEILEFEITANTGYTLENMQVKVNGTKIIPVNNKYSVGNVTSNITIEISGVEKAKYDVTVEGDENCSVNLNKNKIVHGEILEFTITANTGYTLENMKVKVNGTEIPCVNNKYVVENVTSNITIEISGVEKAKCEVSIVYGDNTKVVKVEEGSTIAEMLQIREVTSLIDYHTNGFVYTDKDYTQVADNNTVISQATILYSKPATLDKLQFVWNSTTLSWKVSRLNTSISGEVVIPKKCDNTNDGYVTTVGTFASCDQITSIELTGIITSITSNAFINCASLSSLIVADGNSVYYSQNNCIIESDTNTLVVGCKNSVIPNQVQKIGSAAFYGCTGLEEIALHSGITEIKSNAFSCSGLTKIEIPNGVLTIGDFAFFECSELEEVVIPNSVKTVGNSLFHNCASLTKVALSNQLTSINTKMFFGCKSLTSFNVPSHITEIKDSAFMNSGLTSITIPENVKEIGDGAFKDCSNLTTINFINTTGWQKNTGTTSSPVWEVVLAGDLFDLVKSGVELKLKA